MKKKLKEICNGYTKNIAQKELDDLNGDYEIFGASGLIKKIDYYISEVPYIGIVKDGSGVGRVNSYPAKSSLIGTMQYIVPNKDIDLQFLMYGLRSLNLGNLYRGAAIPHIYFKEYKEFELNVPPKEEQQKIAAELDTIQSAIDNKKQQLALLDEAVKSEFVEMFGENPVESGKWKVERLEDACSSIVDCPHTTPKYEGELKNPAIRTSEIKKGYITWDSMRYVSDNEYEERTARLRPENGDIVYGREGTFGNAAILPKNYKFCLGQRVMLLRPDYSKCVSEYLLYTLISDFLYQQALDKNRLTTVAHVNVKDVKNFKVPIPPLELQTQFASFVQKIDNSKSLVKQQITDLQELLDSKMQEYFGE